MEVSLLKKDGVRGLHKYDSGVQSSFGVCARSVLKCFQDAAEHAIENVWHCYQIIGVVEGSLEPVGPVLDVLVIL